jgi:endonuclease III
MAQPSRTAQIAKIYKVLKKYYKPVNPEPSRSVIEHLLFACCLENAAYEATEEAFAALSHNFFDWNEVRVSTVRELAEEMPRLSDPSAAAQRIKRVLQSIFDATYAFDLEDFRKLNLGPATEKLAKLDGATPFSVAYVVQAALGGHAIPVDQGAIRALDVADMITPEEIQSGQINGLERAITKPKGFEFASLLHQLGADFIANPHSPALVQILVDLNPAAVERMTRRRSKKVEEAESKPAAQDNVPADGDRPPQGDAAEGKPEVKKKRSETRKKTVEKPTPPSRQEAKQAEAKAHEPKPTEAKAAETKHHEPKPAEAKAAETKHHEPKPTEAKAAETKRHEPKPAEAKAAEAKRAVGQAAGGKDTQAKARTPKSSKAQTGESKPAEAKSGATVAEARPAEAKAPASKAPSAKAAEAKSAEPKSSGKHEQQPAQEVKEPGESPAVKRRPAASRKETPAKQETPAVESHERFGGEKE